MKLYKTTVTIYTDCPTMVEGDEWDLETLAREAEQGGAICGTQTCEQVTKVEDVPEGVLSFFDTETIDPSTDSDDAEFEAEWRREIANEAGMMGGCDAYNEAIGSPTGVPAGSRYSDSDEE